MRQKITAYASIIGLVTGSILMPLAQASAQEVAPVMLVKSTVQLPVTHDISGFCQPEAMKAIAAQLTTKVDIHTLPKEEMPGPFLASGVKYTAAAGRLPAYCQVTGSFITNVKTRARANFLATLPANWNQKYLQLGCGGYCGTFAVSDAASPVITITNQGKPGDSVVKGYASFATDQGHAGFSQGRWAIKGQGIVDQEKIDDLMYRSQKVLAKMGKQFAITFYAQVTGSSRPIRYSYFCGCSGGGRDALVAASYFPEEFDGFISGSPASNLATMAFQALGVSLAVGRSDTARVSARQLALLGRVVKEQCDAKDGVRDGLIQNPMACNFRATRVLHFAY
ncbi:MAG: tannase/feruloyl esterase family alpha/beta hydrolase [Rhodoluna sp.]